MEKQILKTFLASFSILKMTSKLFTLIYFIQRFEFFGFWNKRKHLKILWKCWGLVFFKNYFCCTGTKLSFHRCRTIGLLVTLMILQLPRRLLYYFAVHRQRSDKRFANQVKSSHLNLKSTSVFQCNAKHQSTHQCHWNILKMFFSW